MTERGRGLLEERVAGVLLARAPAQREVRDDQLVGARVTVPGDDAGHLVRRADDRRAAGRDLLALAGQPVLVGGQVHQGLGGDVDTGWVPAEVRAVLAEHPELAG